MAITQVGGVRVGHAQDGKARTGVTVVLLERLSEVVCDARGGWPGTYDTDSLAPGMTYTKRHALFFSGGDIYGFDAAAGIRRFLLEKGLAHPTEPGATPGISGALIYDLAYADITGVDYGELAYSASVGAAPGTVAEGSVGAGMGATVGKFARGARPSKGGLGSAAMRAGRFTVGALTVCNAVGNVHDPETGEFIAGARRGTRALRMGDVLEEVLGGKGTESKATTIGVVATDAPLSRDQLWRLALVAHDGLTLAVRPAHLTTDGDAFFALTTNPRGDGLTPDEVDALCYMAVSTTAQAIVRGVMAAQRVED